MIIKGCGNLRRKYGFEYIGDHFDLFICPKSDKALVTLFGSVSQSLRDWRAICLHSTGTQRFPGFVLLQLADTCAEPLVKASLASQEQYR